jgi:signal transduction histidine kinase
VRAARILIGVLGAGMVVAAYRVQVYELGSPRDHALAQVAAGASFVFAGLLAWSRRQRNSMGPLMMGAGFAFLARQLRYGHDSLAFTFFFAISELGFALFAHCALAYPTGRVKDRLERGLLAVAYPTAVLFPLVTLLFYDGTRPLRFFDPTSRQSLLLVHGDADVVAAVQKAYVVFAYGVLASLFIALIVRKVLLATPRARRNLLPSALAAVGAALRAVFEFAITFVNPPPQWIFDNLFWWQITTLIAVPVALVVGLLRSRLAHASVGDLVIQLERAPPEAIRAELASALEDSTLEVAFWLPENNGYVDAAGRAVSLPIDDRRRSITYLEHEGKPVAALVHDPSLDDDPSLIAAAGAAARLALENARLQAELHAQLGKVTESRARIVAAADEERRRIERDLHDGAQQRLVALALELRSAQERLGHGDDQAVDELLADAVAELQGAVTDLRELARGIHPAILTEGGLSAALESLAARSPVPVQLDASLDGRLPANVEATAYFVASEALANVAKHAHAHAVTLAARHANGTLVIEVEDDGVGGAHLDGGSGLRGLVDRVEAQGGSLSIESPERGGSRIVGEIPCAS